METAVLYWLGSELFQDMPAVLTPHGHGPASRSFTVLYLRNLKACPQGLGRRRHRVLRVQFSGAAERLGANVAKTVARPEDLTVT
jgi:hypothetical protein